MKNLLLGLLLFVTTANAQVIIGGGGGAKSYKTAVASAASLPATGNTLADVRFTLDTFHQYVWNGASWTDITGTGGVTGITSLNGLINASQTFATGTAGTDFGISSAAGVHTFNFPSSSATNRGLLTSANWTTFNSKQDALTFTAPLVNTANTVEIAGNVKDTKLSIVDDTDATKKLSVEMASATTGTTSTLSPLSTIATNYNIPQPIGNGGVASSTGRFLVQDETSGYILGAGITAPIGGGNAMFQLANATQANRAQIKLHSYVNAASVAGVSTVTSQSGTIAVNSAIGASQDYSKWTAQSSSSAGAAPITASWAFKSAASGIGGNQVPSDFHISLMNQAGVLGDRLYLDSEGLFKLPAYTAGYAKFDASGNVTSGNFATDSQAAVVTQTITNGVTATAPSEDAVFDALALKEPTITVLPIAKGGTNSSSFTSAAVPYFNGTSLTSANMNFSTTNNTFKVGVTNNDVEIGSVDAFGRSQIWNKKANASMRLGALAQDGDFGDVNAEGVVIYGANSQGTAINSAAGNFGYARIKADRFGLLTSIANVQNYYFRVDPTEFYLKDDAGTKTFKIARTTGVIDTSMGLGIVHSDASGILTSSAVSLTADVSGILPVANGGTGSATSIIAATIVDADTTHAPDGNSVFDALALKESTANKGVASGYASLDGGGTIPTSQLPAAVLGALSFQGTWNANANTPALASGVGTKGYYYVIDTAGTTNIDGHASWAVGDWIAFDGPIWDKIANDNLVASVNGYVGAVVLNKTDIGLSNVTNDAQLKAADLDTDGTLAANSNTKIASQQATKTYADTKQTNIVATTSADYYRGDKTFQPFNAAAQSALAGLYEVPLTFSTGLTRTTNTITVNTSQNISTLSNLTTNGFVKTSGGTGALSIDTNTYQVTKTISSITSNTTGSSTVETYFADTTGGAFTFTLPAAASNSGVRFLVKHTTFGSANSVTVARTGADLIEGGTADTISAGENRTYVSNGTDWYLAQ